jgi:hypothetical protein
MACSGDGHGDHDTCLHRARIVTRVQCTSYARAAGGSRSARRMRGTTARHVACSIESHAGKTNRREGAEAGPAGTQAGEFVREEIEHIREGRHGAQSTKQAIAIGLSKARRAGVKLRAPRKGTTSRATRRRAQRDLRRSRPATPSPRRSRATLRALRRKPRSAASPTALARQAKSSARRRGRAARSAAAQKAVRTKGPRKRSEAARKAARTRARAS